MRKRQTAFIAASAAIVSLVLASASPAAVHVGEDCVADKTTSQKTLVPLRSANPNALLAMPTDGVVTRLQIAGIPGFPARIVQNLKLLRPTGGPNGFATVDEDMLLVKGTTSYSYRLPVRAGDRLGLASDEGDLFFCSGQAGAEAGFTEGNLPLGSSGAFNVAPGVGVPVSASLEPDADGDGYGDETQDLCPSSALVRVACPALGIDAHAVQTAGAADVYVAVYGPGPASVSVTGRLTLPADLSGKRSAVKLTWKGAREASEGKFTRLRLKFPARLVSALKVKGVALPLKLTATATNVAGLASTRKLSLKLR